jgi:glycine cleavage system aminomethyltransferase T
VDRESAGLFDVSHMGQLLITGEGLDAALEAILPADLSLLKDGRLRYSLLLNDSGGIVDDLMVTRREDHFYMVVNGATKAGDIEVLRRGCRTMSGSITSPARRCSPCRGPRRWTRWRGSRPAWPSSPS